MKIFLASALLFFFAVSSVNAQSYGSSKPTKAKTMQKKTKFTQYDPVIVFGTFHIGEVIANQNVDSFYRIDGIAIALDPSKK